MYITRFCFINVISFFPPTCTEYYRKDTKGTLEFSYMFSLFIAYVVSYYLSNLFNIYSALICLMSHDCFLFLFCKAAGSKFCGGLDVH